MLTISCDPDGQTALLVVFRVILHLYAIFLINKALNSKHVRSRSQAQLKLLTVYIAC